MNPYRAKLITSNEKWPYIHIASNEWAWFQHLLDEDCPYPEWLDE